MNPIVTLIDFSDLAPKLLEQSERFGKALGSRGVLLHVVPNDPIAIDAGIGATNVTQPPSEASVQQEYNRLSAMGDLLNKAGVNVTVDQLVGADMRTVLDECERLNPELIIVGSHHHGALYNWFMGSFTSDVLKAVNFPVLVVP